MAQMTLSSKWKQITARESRLVVPRREGDRWAVWGFGNQTVISGMDGQQGPTVQNRELCVIGSLSCTTEIEETLKINYTLMKKNDLFCLPVTVFKRHVKVENPICWLQLVSPIAVLDSCVMGGTHGSATVWGGHSMSLQEDLLFYARTFYDSLQWLPPTLGLPLGCRTQLRPLFPQASPSHQLWASGILGPGHPCPRLDLSPRVPLLQSPTSGWVRLFQIGIAVQTSPASSCPLFLLSLMGITLKFLTPRSILFYFLFNLILCFILFIIIIFFFGHPMSYRVPRPGIRSQLQSQPMPRLLSHINGTIQRVPICVWFLSLSIMSSSSVTGQPGRGLCSFFFFKWLHPWHMEVPGPGIESKPQLRPVPQLWQCCIP